MRAAARAFLDSLYDGQRDVATYDLADPERRRWQYTPGSRGGLALADMDPGQRDLAMSLLDAGLSSRGARTARAIMDLEPVLKAIEERAGRAGADRRNSGHYWFGVFGDPAGDAWGWRVGGHHLCLHFTVAGAEERVTPLFFGANPARVPEDPPAGLPAAWPAGLRVLADEEDLARALLRGLTDAQRTAAVVSSEAPSDILTGNAMRAEIAAVPSGLEVADLEVHQRAALERLVGHYLGRVARPPRVDLDRATFAWAGSTEPGGGHYYAVRTDRFLVEYDNTQNNANHVHTVWRDLDRDWGEDLLSEHYRRAHPA